MRPVAGQYPKAYSEAISALLSRCGPFSRTSNGLDFVHHHTNKSLPIVCETIYALKTRSDQFPALTEVFGEQGVRIDFNKDRLHESISKTNAQLLSQCTAECTFATPWRTVQKTEAIPVECV